MQYGEDLLKNIESLDRWYTPYATWTTSSSGVTDAIYTVTGTSGLAQYSTGLNQQTMGTLSAAIATAAPSFSSIKTF